MLIRDASKIIVENQTQPSLVCEHTFENLWALKGQKSPLLSRHN